MRTIFRPAVLLLLGCCFWRPVPAAVDFADAAAARYSAEQLEFLKSFMAAKQASKDTPVNTLVSTVLATLMSDSRPPMDYSALARDAGAGMVLLEYAEALYGMAQYDLAAEVLAMVPPATQKTEVVRVESVRLRLALRGQGKLPAALSGEPGEPSLALNRALASARRGDIPAAIASLQLLLGDAKVSPSSRDRASLWLSILYAEKGEPKPALSALSGIDSGSTLATEAALQTLRVSGDIHPAAANAVEQRLAGQVPDSVGRWEAREHLIKALERRGAGSQALQLSMQAVGSLGGSISELDRSIAGLGKLSEKDLQSLVDSLPDDARARTEELLKRKQTLLRTAELLRQWRPYIGIYQQRLQRDPNLFSDELRASISGQWSRSGDDSKGGNPGELFRLELVSLLGSPPDRDLAYRLFFGLVQWEFDYEYPDTWRPVAERPGEDTTGKRRRQREAAQKLEKADQRMLPRAMGHIGKLRTKVDTQLKKQQTVVFKGMVERAKSIADRNAATIREIERALPLIDEGVRAEVRLGLEHRRMLAQRWQTRLTGLAVALYSSRKISGQQPVFALDRELVLKPGQSMLAGVQAVGGEPRLRPAEEVDLRPLLAQLKSLSASGASREIQADALRLRAQLVIVLYEGQVIPSVGEAVENLQALQREYPGLADPGDTTYQLARAQDLGQRPKESLATLIAFAQAFPKDPRAAETWFRVGETQFTLGDYPAAQASYEQVIRRGETRYRDQAEYKLAWSLFKMGEYRQALPRFVAILDRTGEKTAESDGRQQERVRDASRAVALTFAYLSGARDVEQYFRKTPTRPYIADIYFNLANYYLEHDRIQDAADSYGYLIRQAPRDARAPSLLAGVVTGAQRENLNKLALEQQERYVDTYAVSGDFWKQAPAPLQVQVNERMQPYLADLGQRYHADAQQTKNPVSFDKAIRYYGQYIATFPKDPQSPRFHFMMAEARFESGDTVRARTDYENAAYQYGAHGDSAAAGYAALVSTQRLAQAAKTDEERKILLRELVVSSGRFATSFPNDERVNTVLVKAAEDMLLLKEPAEAAGYGERLLARKPDEAVRRRAWVLTAHGRFENKEYAKAEAAYQEALAEKGHTPEVMTTLRARLALSVYRQAETYRDQGNNELAIATFLRVGKTVPGSEPVPNAEIDAAVLLVQSRQWGRSIDVLEGFQKSYPTHPLAADVPTRLAFAYENDGRYLKAADMLESLSKTEKDDALARQMAWRAGELRDKGERTDLAVATYERYLIRYPAPLERASEIRQQLSDIAAKSRDIPTRDRWLNELIGNVRGVDGATPRSRFLAARAAVSFGDARAAEFDAIALKLPLDKSLAAKRTALEQSLKWYDEAGRFTVAEVTTAATFKTAELYRRLARDVMNSDRPGGLSELETGQYKILLEEEAFPFEEKATDIHELNHRRIRNGIYDEWVERSMMSLRSLVPARFDRTEINGGYFDYVVPKPVKVEDPKGAAPTGNEKPIANPVILRSGSPATNPQSVTPNPAPQGGSNAANRP